MKAYIFRGGFYCEKCIGDQSGIGLGAFKSDRPQFCVSCGQFLKDLLAIERGGDLVHPHLAPEAGGTIHSGDPRSMPPLVMGSYSLAALIDPEPVNTYLYLARFGPNGHDYLDLVMAPTERYARFRAMRSISRGNKDGGHEGVDVTILGQVECDHPVALLGLGR